MSATLTLRQRILWWSVASSLGILLVAFFFVDESFQATIKRGQEETLQASTRLLAEIQQSEIVGDLDRTANLATTPTLRAALETGDPATIRQNLDLVLPESGLDWIAATTPDGALLASTERAPGAAIASAELMISEARHYDTGDLWHIDGKLVQVHASSIFFGSEHLGVLISGVTVGPQRVERLQAATQQRVAFVANAEIVAGGEELSDNERADLLRQFGDERESAPQASASLDSSDNDTTREFSLAGDRFLGAALSLPNAQGELLGKLVAFRSLEEAMQPARDLRVALLGTAFVGILLAFASSYLLSQRVTRPVNRLLKETVRLGSGNLDESIVPDSDDEIGKLAQGFEQMRISLREAREELVRAERLSAVGGAASAIVHDFRQPIMAIQGYVSLLKMDLDDAAQRQQDLEVIDSELVRLNSMMGEILDFARGGERVEITTGYVSELLDSVAKAVRPQLDARQISLEIDHGYAGEWPLDFSRTRRVLENLVRNSATAVKPGGRIRVGSTAASDSLRLVVEDSGPGIPEAIRDRLFEPFVTHGKKDGTGLGLAIVKAFTERQGGTVTVETSSNGTDFFLDFPRRGAA